ncbi:acyl carrier protein [Virgibacillus senegalensis]|uniref:acyl carrier protein n=1 Tax=Virgibacillus senegalensis TaxID=1499679 RepID=UPI00069E1CC9|nr:acyl carrier protein [Virgibacillus senegalensis]
MSNQLTTPIIGKVIEIVKEITENDEITEANIYDDLDELEVDSLAALELAVMIERFYGYQVTEEDLGQVANLADIASLIESKKEDV